MVSYLYPRKDIWLEVVVLSAEGRGVGVGEGGGERSHMCRLSRYFLMHEKLHGAQEALRG